MNMETKRVTIDGLRTGDVATLKVLTQDVLGLPMNQIHPATVCDLFAIAEVSDQVPEQMAQDLSQFVGRCERELADLPDGDALGDYTGGLLALEASQIPETFRAMLLGIDPDGDEAVEGVLGGLKGHFDGVSPAPFNVAEEGSVAASAADKRGKAKKPAKKTKKTAKKDDTERREWIATFVLGRLANYETGLKESLLVGATRHKAPWDDVTDREVRSVLRAMGRAEKLRTTVGRWLINR